MRKRLWAMILSLCMVLTMMPTVAFADETTSDPVAQIQGEQKSSVYFGNYKQSSDGNGGYLIEPIKWRVLQNADGKLLLLAILIFILRKRMKRKLR